MPKKPTFTEDLNDLDDILNDNPVPKKPTVVVEEDDLDFGDEPEPPAKARPEPVVEADDDVLSETGEEESDGERTGVEVKAEKCEFRIMSDDFAKFIQKIELGGFIKDCYVRVEPDRLYCTFTDQGTGALYGFVGLATGNGIEIVKTGSFIIQDLKKMSKIVNLLSGKIIVSYDNGSIRISSANSKKSAKVISYDKGYVDSLSGMASMAVDLEQGKIGSHNFLTGSSFGVKKEHLKELLEASDAIENAEFRFNASAETDEIMVYISNEYDRISVPFKALESNIKADFNGVYSFPALSKVVKVLGDDVRVFITPAFILFRSNVDHYLYMANESNE